MMTPRSRMKKH